MRIESFSPWQPEPDPKQNLPQEREELKPDAQPELIDSPETSGDSDDIWEMTSAIEFEDKTSCPSEDWDE